MTLFARYIDPTTDFGFKRLFGQEDSKEILKAFLFDVLELAHPIDELTYIPNEQLPQIPDDRIGIYDVYCIDTAGNRFIVEMQRGRQASFRERALYYITFPIIQQVQKGGPHKSTFQILPIYCISVLNFTIDDEPAHIRRIQLADMATGKLFYKNLTFLYIELPKLNQPLEALTRPADCWVYMLKTMPALADIPAELAHEPFVQAFTIAEQARLSPEDRYFYEGSLKRARDEAGIYLTGIEEGRVLGLQEGIEEGRVLGLQEGIEEGRKKRTLEIAQGLLAQGLSDEVIAQVTGLPVAEIEALRSNQPRSD